MSENAPATTTGDAPQNPPPPPTTAVRRDVSSSPAPVPWRRYRLRGSLSELFAGTAVAQDRLGHGSGYGPLVPTPTACSTCPRLPLPRPVPRGRPAPLGRGTGAVEPRRHVRLPARGHGRHGRDARVHLVRNHENRAGSRVPVPTVEGLTYDPAGEGGCTALTLDSRNHVLSERVAIAGTAVNCAGGPTLGTPG